MDGTFHIGINVFIERDGTFLLGKRKNCSGAGDWGLPGGHLEHLEEFRAAAARELMEETAMTASDFLFDNMVNQPGGPKHYIQIGFRAVGAVGEPVLCEPERCDEWRWFKTKELPDNIFFAHREQIRMFLEGGRFSEPRKMTPSA